MSDTPDKAAPPAGTTPTSPRPGADGSAGDDFPDEFAHIPSRPNRPPIIALAAAGLALFLAYQLRHDVGYALSPRTPIDVGDARTLARARPEAAPINRYVRLRGQPERESAVMLDARGSWKFTQFFRLRATDGRVFVRRLSDPLPVPLAERDIFTGRLVRFGELSFAESIRQHFARRVTATHFFAPADFAKAVAAGPPPWRLRDRAGDEVALDAARRLALDVARPDQYLVEVPVDRAADVPRIKALVTGAGGKVLDEGRGRERLALTIDVPAAARDRVLSGIAQLARSIQFQPARDTLELETAALSAQGGALVAQTSAGARTIAFADLVAVRTVAPVQIPDDALLLLEGESPRDETKSLVFLAFLAAFAAINLIGLRRAR